MKKVWILWLAVFLTSATCFAATYYWTGSTNTGFGTTTNWSPTRSVVLASDTLIFAADSTINDTVALITTQTVSFVKITPATNIVVQTGSGKQILSIGDSLVIGSGASLTVNSPVSAADTLVIYLNANARGAIDGSISFNYFGTTTGPRHRLDAADSLAIQFTNGSTLLQNSVGNIFGASAGNNRVVFNPGSQFVQYLGANPFGVSAPGSKVLFKPGSWFRFRMNSLPSFSGRSYANFELDFPTFSQTVTGGNPLSIDTLQITDGKLTLGLQRIIIKGDITIAAAETLLFRQNGTGGVACSLKFYGTTPQTIGNAGTLVFLNDSTSVYVDNAAGLTINRVFPVGYNLNLINGVVTANDTLKMRSDQVVQRTNGYVVGNLAMRLPVGAGLRTFPVGTASGYTPVAIVPSLVTTAGYLTCKAVETTHPNAAVSANTLKRYWTISNDGVVLDSYQMALYYLSGDFNTGFTEADDESTMVAGKYGAGIWTFPSVDARDTAANYVLVFGNTFSEFTFGKDLAAFDDVAPYILSTSPANGDSGVALNEPLIIAFSEPMNPTTFAGLVTPSTPGFNSSWNPAMDTLTFTHTANYFALGTTYTALITDVTDIAGNPLTVLPDSIMFTTVADTSYPYLVWTSPADSQTNVSPAVSIVLAFSEPMDQMSLGLNVFPDPGGSISLGWNAAGDTATFSTGNPFALAAVETIQVVSAQDIFGNSLVPGLVPSTFTFTIRADTTAPHIISTSPADGDSNVPRNQPVKLAFSEPIDPASFNGYSVPDCNFNPSWNATFDTLTLTPDTLYGYSTTITMSCTTGTDISGNRIADLPVSFGFTTVDNEVPLISVIQQPPSTFDGAGPFNIVAVLTDPGKKSKVGVVSNQLYWQPSNDTLWHSVAATAVSGDTFGYLIPGPIAAGLTINAYVEAIDDAGATRYSDLVQFQILNPLAPTGLAATSGQDGTVPLSWAAPAESLYYYIPTSTVYVFDMPANAIASTRYTPSQYPCKINQIRSSWNTVYGTSSMHFRIYGDDGKGFPDEGNVIFDTTYTPAAGTWADLLNLSAYNLVITSGDFHISWEVLTDQQPRPRGTQDGGIQQRSLYKWTDGVWYADLGGDWLNRVAVSYSNYTKGVGLKTAVLKGNDQRFDRANKEALNPMTDKIAKQAANLPAFDLIKNIGDYQVYRSTVSGGTYSFVASTTGLTYDDNAVTNDTTYYYVVRAIYTWASHPDTFSAWSNEASATPTGVEGQPGAISYSFYLMPTSPNPVKGSAEFRFGLAKGAQTSLGIYNVIGQRVKTLINGNLTAGNHTVKWNGCDDNGRKVSSGVYVYRLTAGENTSTKRLTVIR